MAGLVPAIHAFDRNSRNKTWMPGTRPGMTMLVGSVQCLVKKRLELGEMFRHQPGRGRRGRRAPGIARTPVRRADLVQHPFEIGLDEVPRAHVARLFLAPDDLRALE